MARAYPGKPPGIIEEALAQGRRLRRRLRERRCRLATDPCILDEQRAEITVLQRNRLLIDRADLGLSQSLLAHGYWEMWLTEAIERMLCPGMTAIDIGANLGYFTMLMAKSVGPRGRVHAFEPNPLMAQLLAASAARNGFAERVKTYGEPLWDVGGVEAVLQIPETEPKNAHLITGVERAVGHTLVTRRLDSFPNLLDADLVKIDAEGAEEAIWRGMEGLFARGRPLTVFLEYTPDRYEDPMNFIHAITSQGFALAELSVSHGIRSVTPAQILAGQPDEDRMLALMRGPTV